MGLRPKCTLRHSEKSHPFKLVVVAKEDLSKLFALLMVNEFDLQVMAAWLLTPGAGELMVSDARSALLPSHMFGYLHYKHLSAYLAQHPHVNYLIPILMSESTPRKKCGYQNKCTNLTNALVQMAWWEKSHSWTKPTSSLVTYKWNVILFSAPLDVKCATVTIKPHRTILLLSKCLDRTPPSM